MRCISASTAPPPAVDVVKIVVGTGSLKDGPEYRPGIGTNAGNQSLFDGLVKIDAEDQPNGLPGSSPLTSRTILGPKLATVPPPPPPLSSPNVQVPIKENTSTTESSKSTSINPRIPVVKLQMDAVSDTVAARLAASLLGMVLFLKNQIPLPVSQLSRMSGKNSSTKATKHRTELINAFDTLSSHLTTTFSALSTAMAGSNHCGNWQENDLRQEQVRLVHSHSNTSKPGTGRAYLAILLGPSLGTAKSKVFLGIDHFETRVWGAEDESESEEDSEDDEQDEESNEDAGEGSGSEDEGASTDEEGPSDSESESEDSESQGEEEVEAASQAKPQPLQPKVAQDHRISALPPISYADEQRFLQNAERLLSRTLAAADANGYGLASEMSATQTHLLIRAPRNFSHPAWVPRQNVTNALDTSLKAFLMETGVEAAAPSTNSRSKTANKKQKVEGVWLTTKDGLIPGSGLVSNEPKEGEEKEADDDMIWWSWDGKLVGFSDW